MRQFNRILVAGDSHADKRALERLDAKASMLGCEAILVVGDFGYYPKTHSSFLNKAASVSVPVLFIDGNHEDHESLRTRNHGMPREVSPNVTYIPRGYIWNWNGIMCGALGGAYSVDRHLRTFGVDWFDDEVIRYADVMGFDGTRLDILFTHEAPLGYEPISPMPIAESQSCRKLVSEAVELCRPHFLIHGHWHEPRIRKDHDIIQEIHSLNLTSGSREYTGSTIVLDVTQGLVSIEV